MRALENKRTELREAVVDLTDERTQAHATRWSASVHRCCNQTGHRTCSINAYSLRVQSDLVLVEVRKESAAVPRWNYILWVVLFAESEERPSNRVC